MANDPDKEYLVGCVSAGLQAILVLACPIAVCVMDAVSKRHSIYTNSGLGSLFVVALIAATAISVPLIRRGGIPTAFGALGGFACGGAYWYMHIQQVIAKALAEYGAETEYLDSTAIFVAIGWLLIGFVVCLAPLYKNKRVDRKES
ncbi:MAG TPA: hypothetical protein VK171_13345 [Fimbriimonas sp.]|nr:hypothetical protein [Fimbriimonas sp.]